MFIEKNGGGEGVRLRALCMAGLSGFLRPPRVNSRTVAPSRRTISR